jgi:hypothetical protein
LPAEAPLQSSEGPPPSPTVIARARFADLDFDSPSRRQIRRSSTLIRPVGSRFVGLELDLHPWPRRRAVAQPAAQAPSCAAVQPDREPQGSATAHPPPLRQPFDCPKCPLARHHPRVGLELGLPHAAALARGRSSSSRAPPPPARGWSLGSRAHAAALRGRSSSCRAGPEWRDGDGSGTWRDAEDRRCEEEIDHPMTNRSHV